MSQTTPPPSDAQRLLAAVQQLRAGLETTADLLKENDEKIEISNAAIKELAASNQRSRRQVGLLGLSVVLDVVLSIVLAIVGVTALNASHDAAAASRAAAAQARTNAENIRNTCLSANESRALNIQLWDYVLGANANNPDPAQQKRAEDFRVFVHTIFAPKDCGPDPTPETPDPPTSVATVLPLTPT